MSIAMINEINEPEKRIAGFTPEQWRQGLAWRPRVENVLIEVTREAVVTGGLSYGDTIAEARKRAAGEAAPHIDNSSDFFEYVLDDLMHQGVIKLGRANLEGGFVVYVHGEAPWQAQIDARIEAIRTRIANSAIKRSESL